MVVELGKAAELSKTAELGEQVRSHIREKLSQLFSLKNVTQILC